MTHLELQKLIEYYDVTENVILILKMHNIEIQTYVNFMINHETHNHFVKRHTNQTQFSIMDSLNNGYSIFDHKLETTDVQSEIKFSKTNCKSHRGVMVLSKIFARAINGSTNFNNYKTHNNFTYDKILKLSVVCETKYTCETMIRQTSFQKIPFESFVANDNTFNSQFNVGQLLPLHKSIIFHNQYIAIEGNVFESNIDVFIYSILTLTMPIIITTMSNLNKINEFLSELVLHGFDLNGVTLMFNNDQLIHFMHNVKWNDYAKHLNALENNKKILSGFISKEIIRTKNSINEGFALIQPVSGFKNIMNMCYNNDPNNIGLIFKMLADIKTRNEINYDLKHVIDVIHFVYKLKDKKSTNQSTLCFQDSVDSNTQLYHDIFTFTDSKLTPTTNVNTTICCFCPCLEPSDERLTVAVNCKTDIKMTHLHNSDLNLLSSGWMMSWFSDKNYSIFKNNKEFNVSYLFSLRGISTPTEHMKSDTFTYSVRQYIIDNMHELKVPNKIYMTNWNKDLPQKYPHVPLLPDSKQCLYYSMFNVSLENAKQINYYSEKIIDCFLTFTIPLYIGCPNIGEYYDTRGIIIASDAHDLTNKCNSLSPDLYASLHKHCETNHLLVQFWTNQYNHIKLIQNYITFMETCYC